MNTTWTDFTKLYPGKTTVREAFAELCANLMDKHFPGKPILSVNELSEQSETPLYSIIYQAKFFIDKLTNSRKGQIRKAFNTTIEHINSDDHQIFAWCLCVPLSLDEGNIEWWEAWKKKMKIEYNINIKLFDGEQILTLLKKYKLLNKWFKIEVAKEEEKEKEKKQETKLSKTQIDFSQDLIEFDLETMPINGEKKNDEKKEDKLEQENKEETDNKILQEIPEKKPEKKNKEKFKKIYVEREKFKDEITLEDKIIHNYNKLNISYTYNELKEQHKTINNKANELEKNDQEFFKAIQAESKIESKRFDIENVDLPSIISTDLFYNTKLAIVNNKFEKALYLFEELSARNDFEDIIQAEKEDLYDSKKYCEAMIYVKNKIQEGNYYYTQAQLTKALLTYETVLSICPNEESINTIYNETFGDALMQEDLFFQSRKKYKLALKTSPNNEGIELKAQFCHYMLRSKKTFSKRPASLLNPFARAIFHSKATKTGIQNNYLLKSKKQFRKNSIYTLLSILSVIIFFLIIRAMPATQKVVVNVNAKKIVTPYDLIMEKADFYYKNFSNQNAHYIDSAIYYYDRAIMTKPHDSISPIMLKSAQTIKTEFIAEIQKNINYDSAAYFISMRNPQEGLRLFKYLFDPYDKSNGKYGYVDLDMNIVIPPIFDFDHDRMLQQGESFKNGKALVCLKVSETKKVFFYIDQNMKSVRNR